MINQIVVYPISWDPYHQGHYNIEKKWKALYGDNFKLLLFKNPLKDKGLLDIDQRYKDILISKLIYNIEEKQLTKDFIYQELIDIKENIVIPKTKEELFEIFGNSKGIVRGIRNEEDLKYSLNLARLVPNLSVVDKLVKIEQDINLSEVSSSKFKKAFVTFYENWHQLPVIYNFIDSKIIYERCKEDSRIKDIPLSNDLLKKIIEYMERVEKYEKLGYFKDIPL